MAKGLVPYKASLFFALLAVGLSVMLTGCVGRATEIPDDGPLLPASSEAPKSSEGEASDTDNVTLLVYGGWDDEKDEKMDDAEYILSEEHSAVIADLFYHHEKELLDSPISSIASLQFNIGEDYLAASMGALWTFSGRIGGELVAVELSESEYETVYQIISTYVQDVDIV